MRTLLFACVLSLFLIPATALAAYSGPLIDTHMHIQNELDKLFPEAADDMTKNDVQKAVTFVTVDPNLLDFYSQTYKSVQKSYPGKFLFFFDPTAERSEDRTAQGIQPFLDVAPGLFSGMGELELYEAPWLGTEPNDPNLLRIYDALTAHHLPIMLHPMSQQKETVASALQQHSDQIFLFHGWDSESYMPDLMDQYSNFSYTLDPSILLRTVPEPSRTLPFNVDNAQDFITQFDRDYDTMLNLMVDLWSDRIAKHPDRYMWGTDAVRIFHFEPEVYDRMLKFSRDFIGRLPEESQEKVAYKNAEVLFPTAKAPKAPKTPETVPEKKTIPEPTQEEMPKLSSPKHSYVFYAGIAVAALIVLSGIIVLIIKKRKKDTSP